MSKTVYFPDNVNFKNRNFPMLHRLIRDAKLDPVFDNVPNFHGDKLSIKGLHKNLCQLIEVNRYYYNIDLFQIIQFELKRYLNMRSLNEEIELTYEDIFCLHQEKLDQQTLAETLKLLGEAKSLIDYYREQLFQLRPFLVFVHNGSKLYQMACLKICEIYNFNTFVIEHFFTGEHVYIEPQYEPIPNNPHTLKKILDRSTDSTDRLSPHIGALKNLNVPAQPVSDRDVEILKSFEGVKVGLIFGQVFDDYSLANMGNNFILSKELKKLVQKALTENDVVCFKLHPYEKTKHGSYVTKSYLLREFAKSETYGKIYFVEGLNEKDFQIFNQVYGICSQFAFNFLMEGISVEMNDDFFGHRITAESAENKNPLLKLQKLLQRGFFCKTERSYINLLKHLQINLSCSIGCNERDILHFDEVLQNIAKSSNINAKSAITNENIALPQTANHRRKKIKNAVRLLLSDRSTFMKKLNARLFS